MTDSIAIVGMACVYPDANGPEELWDSVLTQRRSMRRIPRERLPLTHYHDSNPMAVDRTYGTQAALIDGYQFDRVGFRVAGTSFDSADMTHWLALDTAARAVTDAGLESYHDLDRRAVGVIVGNTLTGEWARAQVLRLRWPYVGRILGESLRQEGLSAGQVNTFVREFERKYKDPFPSPGEESLAGALSNTIAGRVCNHFDFRGGGYTIDGACASSLLAVTHACSSLANRDLDIALAGGVDISLDPFELVGFARVGALASEEMYVYDERSNGFHPGEGCGFVVLMREEDARRRNLEISALIRGWGISSDGAGGLTRPEGEGQILALERAYRRAGFGVETVDYFEGHGTGTRVGDAVELTSLSAFRRAAPASARPAAIGSIKANVGHTKAAAGVAGLIKGALAIHNELIPPTTACERPHPALREPDPVLRVLNDGECWPKNKPRRVGVSAMGFGGINTHVVLEGAHPTRKTRPSTGDHRTLRTHQNAELFVFSASNRSRLMRKIEHARHVTHRLSLGECRDFAGQLVRDIGDGEVRAAVVASSPNELTDRLDELVQLVESSESLQARHGKVSFGISNGTCRIGFLFPGQGVPSNVGGGELRRRFAVARAFYENLQIDELAALDRPDHATEIAQPFIVAASIATLRVLESLGVRGEIAVGHSLGEITALHWGGAYTAEAAVRIARRRGHAMANLDVPDGSMANIDADPEIVATLTNGIDVDIASYNAPRRTVVSGTEDSVSQVVARAEERGISSTPLRVSHAFHSPLVAAAEGPIAECLDNEEIAVLRGEVYSTVTGERLREDMDLRELLCRQVTSPVRFCDALEAMAKRVDLMIEVGPGASMASLAAESVNIPVLSTDGGSKTLAPLLAAVGAAFSRGAAIDLQALFTDRCVRPFDPTREPQFFVSPCERAVRTDLPVLDLPETEVSTTSARLGEEDALPSEPLELVRALVATRVDLPLSAIEDDNRMLSDLHLNSIVVGELVATAARRSGRAVPVSTLDFANASVREIADAVAHARRHSASLEEAVSPPGVGDWVHAFRIDLVERARTMPSRDGEPEGWSVLAPPDHALARSLATLLSGVPGRGVVAWLVGDRTDIKRLLEGKRDVLAAPKGVCFAVLHHDGSGGGFARTLHLEHPAIHTCVLDVPEGNPDAIGWIAEELCAARGYVDVRFDAGGRRFERVLSPLPFAEDGATLALDKDDVVAVSGGGKGITAECALHLARETGCRLLLMGRAELRGDPALAGNLRRFADYNVKFLYLPTDVTSAADVRAAFEVCAREFSSPTAILHGAGINEPRRIAALDTECVQTALAPKIDGLRNLLAASDEGRLRLLVTFGSIIARLGLPGEAHYALASEWLTRDTLKYGESHPNCRCIALEWSVWAGAGMGKNLDVVDTLRRSGVTPIGIDAGTRQLTGLLSQPRVSGALVVGGRLGEPPTLPPAATPLPLLRFLEIPRVHVPGVEIVADAALSVDSDPYLRDHVFNGSFLFPAVLGLEAMAQTASVILDAPRTGSVVFDSVAFARPISVPSGASLRVRTAVLRRGSREADVVIRSETSDFVVDHFRAVCRIANGSSVPEKESVAAIELSPSTAHSASQHLEIDPKVDLYGRLLFQSGRFCRIVGYRFLRARYCEVELSPDYDGSWFGDYLPDSLVLGDPGGRDAVMHAVQACIPHFRVLPVAVDRILIERGPRPCRVIVCAQERSEDGNTLVYDIDVFDERGRVLEAWRGLMLRVTGSTPELDAGWTVPLLGPFAERVLNELDPGASISVAFERSGAGTRRQRSRRVAAQVVGHPVTLRTRPDGRPELVGGQSISIAHSDEITMAVAGTGEIGCDLEKITPRSVETWSDLLGRSGCDLVRQILEESDDEDLNRAATRVWCAIECLRKVGVLAGPLILKGAGPEGWIMFGSGRRLVATYAARLRDLDPVVLAVLSQGSREGV